MLISNGDNMEKIITKFVNSIATYNNYTSEQKQEIEYTLKIMVYELIKILLLMCIFHLAGYLNESIVILFVMGVTKPFIGGYHEDSQIKCFIATAILIAIIIQLSVTSNISYMGCVLLNLVSVFSIYNRAPVLNDKMPITRSNLIKRNRIIGITNTSILAIGSIAFFSSTRLAQVVVWTICIQTMLMFNKNEFKVYKGVRK